LANFNAKYPLLKTGFNYQFINILLQNCSEQIKPTLFDKHILLLQIHYKEIKQLNREIIALHPTSKTITTDKYEIRLEVPDIVHEQMYYKFIMDNNINNKDILLTLEINKYIQNVIIEEQYLKYNSIEDKNNIIKDLPLSILANCLEYIDSTKHKLQSIYQNSVYGISMLIP
jgi:hypothetical protein